MLARRSSWFSLVIKPCQIYFTSSKAAQPLLSFVLKFFIASLKVSQDGGWEYTGHRFVPILCLVYLFFTAEILTRKTFRCFGSLLFLCLFSFVTLQIIENVFIPYFSRFIKLLVYRQLYEIECSDFIAMLRPVANVMFHRPVLATYQDFWSVQGGMGHLTRLALS